MQTTNPRLPYFKFHPSDFLGMTAMLPLAETGLLITLSAMYWQDDMRLPEDSRLHTLIGWRSQETSLDITGLLDQFFPRDAEGVRRSAPLDALRAEAVREHERNVMNGRQGGRKAAQVRAAKHAPEDAPSSGDSGPTQF